MFVFQDATRTVSLFQFDDAIEIYICARCQALGACVQKARFK